MNSEIPTRAQLQEKLAALTYSQVKDLCRTTGAPFTTIWKIRGGETTDPRLETVRLIWPELIGTEGAPPVPQTTEEVRDAA